MELTQCQLTDWKKYMKQLTPVFIFSLPRSGSTLLQKMLATHDQIAAVAEPWLLLPLAAMVETKNLSVYANFSNQMAQIAISQFIEKLPEKEASFNQAVHDFVQRLYSMLSAPQVTHFVDKTPRYYLIIDFIAHVFPEAKFIFLFRNPLDVLSSIIDTWGAGKLHIARYMLDLYRGPFCLQEGYQRYKERSFGLNYDDLVQDPETSLRAICDLLGLEFSESMMSDWTTIQLPGSMGDQKVNSKTTLDTVSVDQWKRVLNTHLRRHYARRYIKYIGQDILELFGCDIAALDAELEKLPCTWANTTIDAFELTIMLIGSFVSIKVLESQWKRDVWKAEWLM
jgi:hypothetical protein